MRASTARLTHPPSAQRRRGRARFGVRVIVALAAGAGLAAAAAPWDQKWLLPLAVAAFVTAVGTTGLRSALLLGYVFGATYVLTLTSWMSAAVGVDAWLMIGAAVAIFYAVLGVGVALLHGLPVWPLWVGVLWAAVETIMTTWPLGGFPWSRLVWSTADTPLASWLPWVGATGVSLLAATLGAVLSWLLINANARRRAAVAGGVGLAAVLALPAFFPPPLLSEDGTDHSPPVTVAVVQGDVPGAGDDLVAVHRAVTENHVSATLDLAARIERGEVERPDFVLWPENSTAVDPFNDAATGRALSTAAAAVDAPILVGAIVDDSDPERVLNQGIVWRSSGGTEERYTKRHPVPFGEYVPFRRWLAGLEIGRLDQIPRDMVRGTRDTPLDIDGVAVADLICFDVAFDDSLAEQVRNGGQMITVQTSNAMFIKTTQPEQQFTISRLRALEMGRTVVVASVNGISGVIAPDGTVEATLAPRTTDVLVARVSLQDHLTLAVRIGGPLKALILGIAAVALTWAAARSSNSQAPSGQQRSGQERAPTTLAR